MKIHFDFESRSVIALDEYGLDRYARDSSTAILMCAYAFDNGPVELWEPHKTSLPDDLADAWSDPWVTKVAWNAQFERTMLKYVLGITIDYAEFVDPMSHSRHLSMPGKLEDVGDILGMGAEKKTVESALNYWGVERKTQSKDLIKLFCEPASLGGEETLFGISEPSFHDWNSRPKEWALFCDYCRQDVIAERAILKKMEKFPLPPLEQAGWVLDQRINERGVPVDLSLVRGATVVAETAKKYGKEELKTRTGLDNPNSRDQLLPWLRDRGFPFSSLAKGFVERALQGE